MAQKSNRKTITGGGIVAIKNGCQVRAHEVILTGKYRGTLVVHNRNKHGAPVLQGFH